MVGLISIEKPYSYKLVIQSAREKADVQGLYDKNDVESQHVFEKCIQNCKKENILVVIKNLKRLSDRQDTEEVKALYGGGSYTVNKAYIKSFWFKAVSGIAGATAEDKTMLRSSDNMFHV